MQPSASILVVQQDGLVLRVNPVTSAQAAAHFQNPGAPLCPFAWLTYEHPSDPRGQGGRKYYSHLSSSCVLGP